MPRRQLNCSLDLSMIDVGDDFVGNRSEPGWRILDSNLFALLQPNTRRRACQPKPALFFHHEHGAHPLRESGDLERLIPAVALAGAIGMLAKLVSFPGIDVGGALVEGRTEIVWHIIAVQMGQRGL